MLSCPLPGGAVSQILVGVIPSKLQKHTCSLCHFFLKSAPNVLLTFRKISDLFIPYTKLRKSILFRVEHPCTQICVLPLGFTQTCVLPCKVPYTNANSSIVKRWCQKNNTFIFFRKCKSYSQIKLPVMSKNGSRNR